MTDWLFTSHLLSDRGTSGIDIDLRRVDIDQCPLPAGSTALNIFAASDKCKKRTTQDVRPISLLVFKLKQPKVFSAPGFNLTVSWSALET
ncbi:hypothetical protein HAZT_HAZT004302 [Hyalella azteca]|uniref:GPR158/179 extracellular domain-containing protein n=1 Tax=Hyalella azteca TaxID=294128 RepID=A0A6A0H3V0_HYAAZ|nr:hypothetical protein HAZT_HAZT004302 [Hyalella azteca]